MAVMAVVVSVLDRQDKRPACFSESRGVREGMWLPVSTSLSQAHIHTTIATQSELFSCPLESNLIHSLT